MYDKLNRLISVSENGTVIVQYAYDNRNNRIQTTVSGGETTNYSYNLANMLISQTTGDKLTEAYTYYLNGNQKTKTSNGTTTAYEYDRMNRLVKENDIEYTFDDFGNRLTMSDGEVTTTYSYDLNNRLTESIEENGDITTSTKLFYDYNGNQISKAVTTNQPYTEGMSGDYTISAESNENVALYEYNCYNQLVGVNTNGVVSSYTYAPDGLRYSKTVGNDTTTFAYDNANVVEEITADRVNKYYRGFEIVKNNNDLYYLYNGQGDVSILADGSGATVADYVFDAYGNQSEENTVYNPFGYRGEYQDLCSGLIYLRNRYYDPSIGRFITEDPARDGLNWYVYCGNNPINFVDPLGLYQQGDENLPFLINYIINGADGKTGGLTAQWYASKSQKEKERIAKVANMLRCETTDYNLTKTSKVMLLLDENGAYGQGHMAIMIQNSDGQGIYFSYAGEDGTPLDDGMMNIDVLSKIEMDAFFKTGDLNFTYASNGTLSSSNYTKYATINIDSNSGSSMIGKGIYYFWNPGIYSLAGNQCDNMVSTIMKAGGKGYTVQWKPKASFEYVAEHFEVTGRSFGE